jgi:hypothetical protein
VYAVGNNIDHPLTVYVRENAVLDPLDTWLAEAFAPNWIEQSLTALEDAQPNDAPAVEAARRTIAECDRKLARHRAALEAGADQTAPAGTHEIRVVQIAQYSLDFSNLLGPIEWVLRQIGAAGNGQYQVPTEPGNPEDTQVEPPDWYSVEELKGRVSVTSGLAQ